MRYGETGWSCRNQHPELTITALPLPRFSTSSREGRCVCPDTKTSISSGLPKVPIGGRASSLKTERIFSLEEAAGE